LAIFVSICTVACLIIDALLTATSRLREERHRVSQLNASLEERVALRTRDLKDLNARLAAANSQLEAEIAAREQAVAELEQQLAEDWGNADTLAAHRAARDELQALLARWEQLFEQAQA
jgi:C4-dicarboxylate-specific signal transduction histidine kinase